jgi:hypothetical protein
MPGEDLDTFDFSIAYGWQDVFCDHIEYRLLLKRRSVRIDLIIGWRNDY